MINSISNIFNNNNIYNKNKNNFDKLLFQIKLEMNNIINEVSNKSNVNVSSIDQTQLIEEYNSLNGAISFQVWHSLAVWCVFGLIFPVLLNMYMCSKY